MSQPRLCTLLDAPSAWLVGILVLVVARHALPRLVPVLTCRVLFFNDTNNAWVHPKNILLLTEDEASKYMVKPTHKSHASIAQALRMALEQLAESPHPPALLDMVTKEKTMPGIQAKSAPTTPSSAKPAARGSKRRASSATAAKAAKPSKRKRQASPDDMGDSVSAGDGAYDEDQDFEEDVEVPVAEKDAPVAEEEGAERRLDAGDYVDAEVDAEIEQAVSKKAAGKQSGGSRPSRSKRSLGASAALASTPKPRKTAKSPKDRKAPKGEGSSKADHQPELGTLSGDTPADEEPVVPSRKKKSRGTEPSGAPGATTPAPSSPSAPAVDGKGASSGELSEGKRRRHAAEKDASVSWSGDRFGEKVQRGIQPPPTYAGALDQIRETTTKLLDFGADPEMDPDVPDVAHWDKMHKTTTVDQLAEGVQAIDAAGSKLGAAIDALSSTRTILQAAVDKVTLDNLGSGCMTEFEEAYVAYTAAVADRAKADDNVARAVRDVIAAKVTVGMLKHSQAGKPVRRLFKRYRLSSKPVDFLCSMLITQWMGIIENSQRESPSDKEHARDAKDAKASSKVSRSKSNKAKDVKDKSSKEGSRSPLAKLEPSSKAVGKEVAKHGNGVADAEESDKEKDNAGMEAEAAATAPDDKDVGADDKADAPTARDSVDGDAEGDCASDKVDEAAAEKKQSSPKSADGFGSDPSHDDDRMDTGDMPVKPDTDADQPDKTEKHSPKVDANADAKDASADPAAPAEPAASSPKRMEVEKEAESPRKAAPAEEAPAAPEGSQDGSESGGAAGDSGDASAAAHDRPAAKDSGDDEAKASDGGSDN